MKIGNTSRQLTTRPDGRFEIDGLPAGQAQISFTLTGYLTQMRRMCEIGDEFRRRGRLVAIGGPYASLSPHAVRPHADILFIGEAEAGERGAILYTLIECCRRRGIDPYSYLRDVLSRLPDMPNWQVPEVTPAAWAKARSQIIPLQAAS